MSIRLEGKVLWGRLGAVGKLVEVLFDEDRVAEAMPDLERGPRKVRPIECKLLPTTAGLAASLDLYEFSNKLNPQRPHLPAELVRKPQSPQMRARRSVQSE